MNTVSQSSTMSFIISRLKHYEALGYRAGVGMVVTNNQGKIFIAERQDIQNAWQLPQGGIDENETPLEAAYRELFEETGICKKSLVYLQQSSDVYSYDFTDNIAKSKFSNRYVGQAQVWFLFKFLGHDSSINLHQNHPEFRQWRWALSTEVIDLIAEIKKEVYKQVFYDFSLNIS